MRLRPATDADDAFCLLLNELALRECVEPIYGWDPALFGILPFLIARYFAARRIYARFPMSDLALRRTQAFTWTYRIFFVAAVLLCAIGWLLAEDHGPTVALSGALTHIVSDEDAAEQAARLRR